MSWLDWWFSTCGCFREHLPVKVLGNFERLMLSGLRALEFLGAQGIMAFGNLVLSHRDPFLWMPSLRFRLKRLHAYAMQTFPRHLEFFRLPCWTLP